MFYDIMQTNPSNATTGNPPISYSPTLYFGNLSTYTQGGGVIGPSNLSTMYGAHKPPSVMNFSFGIQQRAAGVVFDASYVGSLSRNMYYLYNINPIPIGAHFNPANFDPTQPGTPLPDNFLRRYAGFGNINVYDNGASSNYNSLQVSVSRRLARGLQFGAAGIDAVYVPFRVPFDTLGQFIEDVPRLGIRGLERRMHGNGDLHADHEHGEERHGELHRSREHSRPPAEPRRVRGQRARHLHFRSAGQYGRQRHQ